MGKQVPEFSWKDIREIVSGNYSIIYLLNDNAIFILRINHSARVLRRIK
nr:type II toxin-antitoxin system RelE/ParE family toxin [Bacteroidota bacterium]